MSVNSTLFAVRIADHEIRPELDRRIEALRRFYEPLGSPVATSSYVEPLRLLIGRISFDGSTPDHGPLAWGGPLPSSLRDEGRLLEAGDRELRELDGIVAVIASAETRARMISGAAGIATLHRASSDQAEAFATQAVAAAWLASGRASIAAERIPELVARGYVGGQHSLVSEVRVLPPATRIEFTERETRAGTYWPASDRWEPIAEEDAYEHTRAELLAGLERRVPGQGAYVALTAGLDSRVVAVALHELGRPVGTFTWGEPDWEDVRTASRAAAALALDHTRQPIEYRDDQRALAMVDSEVRWTEGITPVRFTAQTWPPEMRAVVYGTGGETGRAFYYGDALRRTFPSPTRGQLERIFDSSQRIHGAERDALRQLRASERAWIAEAEAVGATGWRCLDLVYAEQRVRRWGRSMLSRLNADTIPAFATPEIARGLSSLPLADRVTDGFHRRFLSGTPAPQPPIPAPAAPRPRLRRALGRLPGAQRAAAARRAHRRPPTGGRWYPADEWPSRPLLRSWIAEEALGSTLIAAALGSRWAEETRAGFLKEELTATENAMLAASPYALERALRDLAIG
jgi:hypothetical protein